MTKLMYYKKDFGNYGEDLACSYLIRNGYKIIDRNFLCRQGEIDIVAMLGSDELVFVEVKARKNLRYGMPCEAVNLRKKANIISSSKYYVYKHNLYNLNIRYDIIEIFGLDFKLHINHLKNVFN